MTLAELAGELPKNWPQVCGLITILGYMVWRDWRKGVVEASRDVKLDEMYEQTVNDHSQQSNMRDDIDITRDATIATHDTTDDIYNVVRDMQERQMAQGRELFGMRADMTGVRADMTSVRADVTSVSKELHDERQRSIETDASLWRSITGRGDSDERG